MIQGWKKFMRKNFDYSSNAVKLNALAKQFHKLDVPHNFFAIPFVWDKKVEHRCIFKKNRTNMIEVFTFINVGKMHCFPTIKTGKMMHVIYQRILILFNDF